MRDHDVSHVHLSAVPPEDLTSHDNYMISCKLSDSRFIGQVTTSSRKAFGILALEKKLLKLALIDRQLLAKLDQIDLVKIRVLSLNESYNPAS